MYGVGLQVKDVARVALDGTEEIEASTMAVNRVQLRDREHWPMRILVKSHDRMPHLCLAVRPIDRLDLIQNYVKAEGHSFLRMDGAYKRIGHPFLEL